MIDFKIFEDERWDVVAILEELEMVTIKQQGELVINREKLASDLSTYKKKFFDAIPRVGRGKAILSKGESQRFKEYKFSKNFTVCYQTLSQIIKINKKIHRKTLEKVYMSLLELGEIKHYK